MTSLDWLFIFSFGFPVVWSFGLFVFFAVKEA